MDSYNDIVETVQDDEVAKVRNIWDKFVVSGLVLKGI